MKNHNINQVNNKTTLFEISKPVENMESLTPLHEHLAKYDINDKDELGRNFLMFACLNNLKPIIKEILSKGDVDITATDNSGYTVFRYAINDEITALLQSYTNKDKPSTPPKQDITREGTQLPENINWIISELKQIKSKLKQIKTEMSETDTIIGDILLHLIKNKK